MCLLQFMNKVKPCPHPEVVEDYAPTILTTMQNGEVLRCLGFSWLRSSRLSTLKYMPFITLIKLGIIDYKYKQVVLENLKMWSQETKIIN